MSVVIPTYNREKTIERCIRSVTGQTYQPYEIIAVDDGSSDRTIDVLEKIGCSYLKIITQNHKGAQAARNAGIMAATGDYIAFLDSDDEWIQNKLELQVQELIKKPDAVVCGNGYLQMDWKDNVPKAYKLSSHQVKSNSKKILTLNGKSGYVYGCLLRYSFCLFPSIMVSKKNLITIGFLDEKVPAYQEWDTAIRLAKKYEFVFINKPLFIYHLHDGETISKSTKRAIDGMEYNCKKFQYDILGQLGPQALKHRYFELMKLCIQYKDKRFLKYLLRYCFGTINIFLLK
mgnify:FL=1